MSGAADLSRRSFDPELMDTEQVSFEEFQHCLRDLRRINLCTLAYRPTLTWLGRVVERTGRKYLRILDVGFGYGDMLREIDRWARQARDRGGVDGRRSEPVVGQGRRTGDSARRQDRLPDRRPVRLSAPTPPATW